MQSSTLINHEFVPHDSQHIIHRCCHRFPSTSGTFIRSAVPSFSRTEKKLDNRPHPSCSWEHFAPCPVKDLERAPQPNFEGNLLWEWLFALLRVWNQYRNRKYKFPLCLDRVAGCCTEFRTSLIIRFRELDKFRCFTIRGSKRPLGHYPTQTDIQCNWCCQQSQLLTPKLSVWQQLGPAQA